MSVEAGKSTSSSIRLTERDRARADLLIDAELAPTLSDAIRLALAVSVRVIERISATMAL